MLIKSLDLYKKKYSRYFKEHYEIIKIGDPKLAYKIEKKYNL